MRLPDLMLTTRFKPRSHRQAMLTHAIVVNYQMLRTNVDSVALQQHYGGLIVGLEG
jgi:hypothetical protein